MSTFGVIEFNKETGRTRFVPISCRDNKFYTGIQGASWLKPTRKNLERAIADWNARDGMKWSYTLPPLKPKQLVLKLAR